MTKRKKQLYLITMISPIGLKHVSFKLTNDKPDPYRYTRGEGNCLIFKLVDRDYSTEFFKALEDGRIMNDVGEYYIEADLSSIPKAKKKHDVEIAKLKKEKKHE